MHEKSKLIQSMGNLINHINTSRQNQQQIFTTFSKEDFKKIMTNLQDSNSNIRQITLSMISQLLYSHRKLQKSFCQIMNICYIPGKLVLTNKFPISNPTYIKQILTLLKSDVHENDINSVFWYIDPTQSQPRIRYAINNKQKIDPFKYITGIILLPQRESKPIIGEDKIKSISTNKNVQRSQDKSHLKRKTDNKQGQNNRLNKSYKLDFKVPITSLTKQKQKRTQNMSNSAMESQHKESTSQSILNNSYHTKQQRIDKGNYPPTIPYFLNRNTNLTSKNGYTGNISFQNNREIYPNASNINESNRSIHIMPKDTYGVNSSNFQQSIQVKYIKKQSYSNVLNNYENNTNNPISYNNPNNTRHSLPNTMISYQPIRDKTQGYNSNV